MLKLSLTLAAALAVAAPALAQDYTIRAVANSNEEDEDYDGLQVFKSHVEAASNGAIAVEIYMGTQLCSNGAECLQGVADGSIDVYISTLDGAAGLFPYFQVLDLPYLMSDDRVAEKVLSGEFMRSLRDRALADSGDTLRLMTIGNTGGWRSYANTQRQVSTPADLQGLKMRTVVADLPQELARAMGASPTPIPWPELFTSLQTRVVEGTANGITDIMSMRFPEAGLTHLTLDQHSYMGAYWWMSNESFMALPEEQRRIVVDGFYALQQATFASPKRKSIAAYEAFAAAGGQVYVPTTEERAAFSEAAQPVYEWFTGTVDGGEEILAEFRSAVEAAEAEINDERSRDIQ
ncbi:TRAP transporter substrate-binding protein DctP [Paracoccus tibetensis]|uniref:TRAP-type C4-dicarboxylate transport system, substrate-binding protein n=1 Tax=Paracoccus tibetensis TaxID=336292 RepID=A0A1G5HR98_9RHOB|nr:TRAP transporter substrate-binding protein DctP [Paracoccus tibetensis]SCY66395.1 TRAP-type C4-dicarboxylate transport system, substrate-binding protein [Paracoccus tibetensis]